MTEEFASAMVTVIPVILLVAVVEFNEGEKRAAEAARSLALEAQASGVEAGRVVRKVMNSRVLRRIKNVQSAWYAVLTFHVLAEGYLILWLADDHRPASPGYAWFVVLTACAGFLMTLASVVLTRAARGSETYRYLRGLHTQMLAEEESGADDVQ
jgi:hypothetical protein